MPLLDIEKVIKKDKMNSRFKLVYVAGLRARELNTPKEDTLDRQIDEHSKVTTTALSEVIEGKINYELTQEPDESVLNGEDD